MNLRGGVFLGGEEYEQIFGWWGELQGKPWGLRMKILIWGLLKNPIFRGVYEKQTGLGQFSDIRWVLIKKRGWYF